MGIRRAEISEGFWEWPTRRDWHQWVRRMGLDVDSIPLPTQIEADDDARTVTVEYMIRGPKCVGFQLDESGSRIKRVAVTIQLESPALPMPRVYA